MNTDELIHYGVLGMRWGRRRERRENALRDAHLEKKAGEAGNRAYSVKDRLTSATTHDFNAKKSAIKAKIRRADAKSFEDQIKGYEAIDKKYDKLHKTTMKDLSNRTDLSPFKMLVEKYKANIKIQGDYGAELGNYETKLENKWRTQEKNISADKKAAYRKMESEARRLYETQVKNLPFPKDIVESVKLDRQLERQMQLEILNSQLRNS